MDRYSKSQLMRSLNRSNDIEVSQHMKEEIELTAIQHLRAGNLTEYAMCMSTLSKIDTVNALNTKIDSTEKKLSALINQLGGNTTE